MRLFHGHDEVVAIPGSDQSEEQQRCEIYIHTSVSGDILVMAKLFAAHEKLTDL